MTTKRTIKFFMPLALVLMLAATLTVPAFALTEAEVEAQVSATSKEAVTGNVLIWFLCAIAFLKISQKIDSFMASLGVNVGHTGGSMLAEVMIATRGITTVAGAFGGGRRTGSRTAAPSQSGSDGTFSFFKGGLAGIVSRKVTNDAVKTATTATSAVNSIKSDLSFMSSASVHTAADAVQQNGHSTQQIPHTDGSIQAVTHEAQTVSAPTTIQGVQPDAAQAAVHDAQDKQTEAHISQTASHTEKAVTAFKGVGLGGAMFAKSLMTGGSFANDVIGTVARGDIRSTGSITGDLAAQSLQSYLGYTALGDSAQTPAYSDVEIGGGRITGVETIPGSPVGVAFGMYQADQYSAPQGEYTKVHSADGALWYKQYAQDAVERKPYKAPDGTVAYHENIVKKLPDPPKRKERI